MFYVYVLQSKKDNEFYTGCTQNLSGRFTEHNLGNVFSTKYRRPWKLIFYEGFLNKKDAFMREKWLKTGWGRNHLRKILSNYLVNFGG